MNILFHFAKFYDDWYILLLAVSCLEIYATTYPFNLMYYVPMDNENHEIGILFLIQHNITAESSFLQIVVSHVLCQFNFSQHRPMRLYRGKILL